MKPSYSILQLLSLITLSALPLQAAIDDSTEGIRIYSGNDNTHLDLSTVPADKTRIIFNMSSGGSSNWFEGNNLKSYAGDVQIGDGTDDANLGLIINNGNSNNVAEFSGAVTGAGLLSKTGNGKDSKILFSGDVTAFTGNIQLGSSIIAPFTLQFGKESSVNHSSANNGVSGTGTITFAGSNDTLVYDYAGTDSTVYVTNAIGKSGDGSSKVTIANSAAMEFTQNVVIDTLTVSNSSAQLTFSGGGTLGTVSGTAAGITKTGDNTLTITGNAGFDTQTFTVTQGILEYKNSGGGHLGTVNLGTGTTLGIYNTAASGANTLTVDHLHLDGNATLQGESGGGASWPSIFAINSLTGENKTLTIDASAKATLSQWVVINGGNFSGTLNIQQNDGGAGRKLVVVATDTTALADAVVDLNRKNSSGDSLLVFSVGGAADNEVKIAGLTGIAGSNVISGGTAANINTTTLASMQDGNTRTLTLTGSGDYNYEGSIGSNLIINKTGTGSQTLHGVSDNVTFNVSGGSLTLAGSLGENVLLGASSGTVVTKSGEGKLILTELGNDATFNLNSGTLWIQGTVGTGASIVTTAGTSVYIGWQVAETAANSGIFTATLPSIGNTPDFITGDGTIQFDTSNLVARGDTSLNPVDRIFTRVDASEYTGDSLEISAGLVSVISGDLASPGALADFGTINTLILNGGGLVLNTEQSDFNATFAKNIQIGDRRGYLRAYQNSNLNLSGAVTGTGSLVKTDAGDVTLSGDMSAFTGSVVIGAGGLIFDTNAAVSSLQLLTNTAGSYLAVKNGHTLTVGGSTTVWTPEAGVNDIRVSEGANIQINRIRFTNESTLNLTAENGSYGSLTVTGLQCADTGNTTINVGKNTALNITGESTGTGAGEAYNASATFLLTHWNSHAVVLVEGTLNMLNCSSITAVNLNNADSTLTVNDGGILNLKGLSLSWRDGFYAGSHNVVITLNEGSAMHLGSEGIGSLTGGVLNLNGGTIGILDATQSWNTSQALELKGTMTFDTRLYTAATDGTAGTYSATQGGTITLGGNVSGAGSLVKEGVGTLELTAANTYTGDTQVKGGELNVSGSIGNDASANTYTVEQGARLALSGSGSVANAGATLSVRNGAQTLAGDSAPSHATFENVTQTVSSLASANGTDKGSVNNAEISITSAPPYTIEKIDLVNSLVTLQSSASVTMNDVSFDAGSAFEIASGATGTATLTGTGNSLTVGLTGKTVVTDTTVSYNGQQYAQATSSQLAGITMAGDALLTIDLANSLLCSGNLNGQHYLALTLDGLTSAEGVTLASGNFALDERLTDAFIDQATGNTVTPSIIGVEGTAGGTVVYINFAPATMPEPSSSMLALFGLTGLLARRRRKNA